MYKLTTSTSILRSDGAYIPADPDNRDYAEYLVWINQGNQPEPADPTSEPETSTQDPVAKLQQFLSENPDVKQLLKL